MYVDGPLVDVLLLAFIFKSSLKWTPFVMLVEEDVAV
jgi:hypothetical protein